MLQGNRAFLTVVLTALAIRLLWALLVPMEPTSDGAAYDTFARNIALHGVYGWNPSEPTAYWPVGTAAVYAALYKLFGTDYPPIVIFNLMAGIAGIVLTMLLARRWFGEKTALAAGLLLAFWPGQVMFTTVMASELMFTALTLAALLLLESKRLTIALLLLSGLLIVAAAYIRTIALLFPFLFAFLLWARNRDLRQASAYLLTTLLVAAVCIAPWSQRNSELFGGFALISTNGGAILWMGNNPDTNGAYQPLPEDVKGLNELEREKVLKQRAVAHIVAEPAAFVLRSLKKALRMYERETIGVHWNLTSLAKLAGDRGIMVAKAISQAFWIAALLLAVYGLIILFRSTGPSLLLHAMVMIPLYVTAVHAVFLYQDRYHYPVVPFLAVFAGAAVVKLLELRAARSQP